MNQLLLFEDMGELFVLRRPPRPLSERRRAIDAQTVLDLFDYEPRPERPRLRSQCRNGMRPCPWVSCRYHLYLDVDEETGRIKFNFPGLEPWELEHSCCLDIVEAGEGDPLRLADLGELYGVGPERMRQIVNQALEAAYEVASALGLEAQL